MNTVVDLVNAADAAVDQIQTQSDPASAVQAIREADKAWSAVLAALDVFDDAEEKLLPTLPRAEESIAEASGFWVLALATYEDGLSSGSIFTPRGGHQVDQAIAKAEELEKTAMSLVDAAQTEAQTEAQREICALEADFPPEDRAVDYELVC